jgi:hypothetical protein
LLVYRGIVVLGSVGAGDAEIEENDGDDILFYSSWLISPELGSASESLG